MDAESQKFEKARDKFRRRMREEQEKRSHTMFLTDDEIPSTSKGGGGKTKTAKRSGRRQAYQTRQHKEEKRAAHQFTRKSPPTVHFRMATTQPPWSHVGQPEVISVSEDEDCTPPPPPLGNLSPPPYGTVEEDVRGEKTTGLVDDDEIISLGDLYIEPEDLADPLVREFYRTFMGATDTTVEVRPTPPSSPFPPSSPSSIDWENENYRPPTPPRPRRYGSFEIQDRQFLHLGMHCYERVWRARLLMPRKAPTPALPEATPNIPEVPGSPPWQSPRPRTNLPPTPGRGWLHTGLRNATTPSPSSRARSPSPIPPPPPLQDERTIIPPPPPLPREYRTNILSSALQCQYSPNASPAVSTEPTDGVNQEPLFEELPVDFQNHIRDKLKTHKGKRYRSLEEIGGCWYRITIKPNSEVQITLVKRN